MRIKYVAYAIATIHLLMSFFMFIKDKDFAFIFLGIFITVAWYYVVMCTLNQIYIIFKNAIESKLKCQYILSIFLASLHFIIATNIILSDIKEPWGFIVLNMIDIFSTSFMMGFVNLGFSSFLSGTIAFIILGTLMWYTIGCYISKIFCRIKISPNKNNQKT